MNIYTLYDEDAKRFDGLFVSDSLTGVKVQFFNIVKNGLANGVPAIVYKNKILVENGIFSNETGLVASGSMIRLLSIYDIYLELSKGDGESEDVQTYDWSVPNNNKS